MTPRGIGIAIAIFLVVAGIIVGILFAVGVFSSDDAAKATATTTGTSSETELPLVYRSDLSQTFDNAVGAATFVNKGMTFTELSETQQAPGYPNSGAYAEDGTTAHFYSDDIADVVTDEFTISFRVNPTMDIPRSGIVLFAFNKVGERFKDNVMSVETGRVVYNNETETGTLNHSFESDLVAREWTRVVVRMKPGHMQVSFDDTTVLDVDLGHVVTIPSGARLNMFSDYDGSDTDTEPLANGNFMSGFIQDLRVYNAYEVV